MNNNITWIGNALVVELPKHKGDQEGKHACPKHVYATKRPFSVHDIALEIEDRVYS